MVVAIVLLHVFLPKRFGKRYKYTYTPHIHPSLTFLTLLLWILVRFKKRRSTNLQCMHQYISTHIIHTFHTYIFICIYIHMYRRTYIHTYIPLIKKMLSFELLHCALLHTQTATHHGCNEFVYCYMPRPQSIVIHIASMAYIRMPLSHSRHLQCYLKIRYIHGALRFGYATMLNAQCNNS